MVAETALSETLSQMGIHSGHDCSDSRFHLGPSRYVCSMNRDFRRHESVQRNLLFNLKHNIVSGTTLVIAKSGNTLGL
jgi:hypothetical protein